MKNKITFCILSHSGARIKQVAIPQIVILFSSILILGVICVISTVLFNYMKLNSTVASTRSLENQISFQLEQMELQKTQIQNFASEINTFKEKLINLNDFEHKIRIIANIEKKSERETIFGIGGSVPKDLETEIATINQQNSLVREMHEQVQDLNLASVNQKDDFKYLLKHLEDQRNFLAATPAICPTKGWVTSKFGYRTSPFTGRREFHRGLDIASRKGTPVLAPADGVISYASPKGLMGNMIVIDHGHGMITRYGHLSKILKTRGKKVKRGDMIARIGNTGRSTGPHLHYEIIINGVRVDPEKYILN